MDDVLILIANSLLAHPSPDNLLAFVKLQATQRGVWLHFKHDRELWARLLALLPTWSLPEHMGLRRRAITSIKLLSCRCVGCDRQWPRVFVSIQARMCALCCRSLLISDFHLAWHHGIVDPRGVPYIARYTKDTNVRVRFFVRKHFPALCAPRSLSSAQTADYLRRWPGVRASDVAGMVRRMGA